MLCGFYPRPGGDEETLAEILKGYLILEARYPTSSFILLGDANIHLSYLLRHALGCACLHCRQTAVDKRIERALDDAGLFAFYPAKPTHVDGACLDLLFTAKSAHLDVEVVEEVVGLSDH